MTKNKNSVGVSGMQNGEWVTVASPHPKLPPTWAIIANWASVPISITALIISIQKAFS